MEVIKVKPYTKTVFTEVTIEQGFIKRGKKIYHKFRINGKGKWTYRLTPYKEYPYAEVTKQFPII